VPGRCVHHRENDDFTVEDTLEPGMSPAILTTGEGGGPMTVRTAVRGIGITAVLAALPCAAAASAATAHADNSRLNKSVVANVYQAQRENGCEGELRQDDRLAEAARQHTFDVRDHRDVNDDIGSDGSTPGDRAAAAGFVGKVSETIAINPALAINGVQILNQWWYDLPSRATMQDCRNTAIGVWSENSLDRTVVVAVYGQPAST
jgi:uncharacterized protein YkwD